MTFDDYMLRRERLIDVAEPRIAAALRTALTSDNDVVRQSLDRLVVAVYLAHGEQVEGDVGRIEEMLDREAEEATAVRTTGMSLRYESSFIVKLNKQP